MFKVKGRDIRDLALASFDLTVSESLKNACLEEILQFPKSAWYKCEFRNCDLLIVHGGRDVLEKDHLDWRNDDNLAIKELIDLTIEPYFHRLPRLIVLKTPPNQILNWHVDCDVKELESFQPKLRILLQGKSDDLYFKAKSGDSLPVRTIGDVYYMSGVYTHALKNTSDIDRYVLCLGSPWQEEDVKPAFIELIEQANPNHLLWNDELQTTDRCSYVRRPKEHGLRPYGQW